MTGVPVGAAAAVAVLSICLLASIVVAVRGRRRAAGLGRALGSAHQELERLQQAFHRFAPQQVVEDIIERGVTVRGEKRKVTVLFADIMEFTARSERMEADSLVRMLNGYFEAMSRAITAHRGHLSKLIGDGLLALFGAPDPNPWQERDAVHAALAMQEAVSDYNRQLSREGVEAISIGVGIHTGDVVAGVIGSAELMDFTVVGDVVNTASRIESLTRRHRADILISRSVRAALDDSFRLVEEPPVEVKGKREPLVTFSVERPRNTV